MLKEKQADLQISALPMRRAAIFGRATLLFAANCSQVSEGSMSGICFLAWRTSIFISVSRIKHRFSFFPQPESFMPTREKRAGVLLSITLSRFCSTCICMD